MLQFVKNGRNGIMVDRAVYHRNDAKITDMEKPPLGYTKYNWVAINYSAHICSQPLQYNPLQETKIFINDVYNFYKKSKIISWNHITVKIVAE